MIIYIASCETINEIEKKEKFTFSEDTETFFYKFPQKILSISKKEPLYETPEELPLEVLNDLLLKNILHPQNKRVKLSSNGVSYLECIIDSLVNEYNIQFTHIYTFARLDLKETGRIISSHNKKPPIISYQLSLPFINKNNTQTSIIIQPPSPTLQSGECLFIESIKNIHKKIHIPYYKNFSLLPDIRKHNKHNKHNKPSFKKDINLNDKEFEYFLHQYSHFQKLHLPCTAYQSNQHQLYIFQNIPYIRSFLEKDKLIGVFFPFCSIYSYTIEIFIPPTSDSFETKLLQKLFNYWELSYLNTHFYTLHSFFTSLKLGWMNISGNHAWNIFKNNYPISEIKLEYDEVVDISLFNVIPEQYNFDINKYSKVYQTANAYLKKEEINENVKRKILKNFPQI